MFTNEESCQVLHALLCLDRSSITIMYKLKNLPFNPLPDDKILGLPKLKAFAEDKLNVTQNVKVVFHRIENIVTIIHTVMQ